MIFFQELIRIKMCFKNWHDQRNQHYLVALKYPNSNAPQVHDGEYSI